MSQVPASGLKVGDVVEGEVFRATSFGAFVKLANGQKAFLHISQIAEDFVQNISDHLKLGARVRARVLNIEKGRIDLTLKKPKEDMNSYPKGKEFKASAFEDKLRVYLDTAPKQR